MLGAEFASKVLRAVKGEKALLRLAMSTSPADKDGGAIVKKEIGQELEYFSAPVELG